VKRVILGAALVAAVVWPSGASAATREYWVGAERVTWNVAPNERDGITGTTLDPFATVRQTTVYRRFSKNWHKAEPNLPAGDSGGNDMIPGPLLRARVGDKILVHFKNMEPAGGAAHSMHFHGVRYKPSSDGAYVPGFSGRDGEVMPGQSYTYELNAVSDSAGVWPYHDHSVAMDASIEGGMYGMLSIIGRHDQRPDREFVVVFAAMGDFQTIDGRAFVGNTPVFKSKVGETIQWDVMGMGSEHHTFHVHGHRWRTSGGTPEDTRTVGPAESFKVRWKENDPGTWLYHCHVESHMASGMIGIYQVSR
jgi:FtsP/CotA-like multicopper oxidase with cupredoxin domain